MAGPSTTSLHTQFSTGSSNDGRSVGDIIEPDDVSSTLPSPDPQLFLETYDRPSVIQASDPEADWSEEQCVEPSLTCLASRWTDFRDRSTKSLRDSVYNYITENGRTYHAYQAGCK
jgi:hypothetical protein